MTEIKEECEELLKGMSLSDRGKALKTWVAIQGAETKREVEIILDQIERNSPVAKFIGLMFAVCLEDSSIKEKQEKLKENAVAVKEDALKILLALIPVHTTVEDKELVKRAIEMARQLQDAF